MKKLKTEVYDWLPKGRLTWKGMRIPFYFAGGEWRPGWVFQRRHAGWTYPV